MTGRRSRAAQTKPVAAPTSADRTGRRAQRVGRDDGERGDEHPGGLPRRRPEALGARAQPRAEEARRQCERQGELVAEQVEERHEGERGGEERQKDAGDGEAVGRRSEPKGER